MSLLSIIAGGMPTLTFNLDAAGSAVHCRQLAPDAPEVRTERRVPMAIDLTGQSPALVITLDADAGETVEIGLVDALYFVREATGLDVAALFAQVAALV